MALFKPFRGNSIGLDAVPKTDGHAYFCTDDGNFWIDYLDPVDNQVKRKLVNDVIVRTLQADVAKKYDIAPYYDYVGSVPCTVMDKNTKTEKTDVAVMAADNEKETIIFRDKQGRAKVSSPADPLDIANKEYADTVSKKYRHRIQLNVSVPDKTGAVTEYQISGSLISGRATNYTTDVFLNEIVHTSGHPTLMVITGHNINDAAVRIVGGYYVADGSAQWVSFYVWNSYTNEMAIVEGTPRSTVIKTNYAPVEI
jgi:hypothetical protein